MKYEKKEREKKETIIYSFFSHFATVDNVVQPTLQSSSKGRRTIEYVREDNENKDRGNTE
jgi:hypothetical protein